MASLSDGRDASQRFLVRAFRRVARQRQSQYEFDCRALFSEMPNNLISCHYYNKNILLVFFLLGVSSFIFKFYLFSLFFTSFHLFIPSFYCALFFSISKISSYFISLFHFTFPLIVAHRILCNTSNDILTLSTVYYSAPNTAMGQESKI